MKDCFESHAYIDKIDYDIILLLYDIQKEILQRLCLLSFPETCRREPKIVLIFSSLLQWHNDYEARWCACALFFTFKNIRGKISLFSMTK
jgi:hypothetical protein